MTDRDLMQQALDALERYQVKRQDFDRFADEITALTERLAHCDRCGKKLGGKGDIHTCTPLIGCVQHDCAECKARLAQPEQEPVKFNCTVVDDAHYHDGRNIVGKEYADHSDVFPLYARPQAREPLTDEQIESIWDSTLSEDVGITALRKIARAIENAHGIKENT